MRTYLLAFLKLLEAEIKPPNLCHHAITCGSHIEGDNLTLQVHREDGFHEVYLDDADFEKTPRELVALIVAGLPQPVEHSTA